jgi:hypothetical protein
MAHDTARFFQALANGAGQPLAAFTKEDGTLAIGTSCRFTRRDYAMALRWFFDELPMPRSLTG